ncbi:UDP-glucose 4-epimerase family protein [Marinobacter sp. M5B]|uniref:UDP-glucose 4-epimerase family protein n=1 Tax=Marinobacter sp. M5B TaxID=3141535 RepID=UPI0036D24090
MAENALRNVLVTGSNGFVGRHLISGLCEHGLYNVRGAVRQVAGLSNSGIDTVMVGDMDAHTGWKSALHNVDVVIHTAARVHVMDDNARDPLGEFREVNVRGTLNLAQQAADNGVKRLIFISSIKVNGEETSAGMPYTAGDTPAPEDPYGISKLEAEQGLLAIAEETGIEVVIIRPPLVYGPGVKGNFSSLMKFVGKGMPLPLGAVHNKRSLVACTNLVDFIIRCIDHPSAANQVFLVSDGEDLSTTELLKALSTAAGRHPRLIPIPHALLNFGATVLGKKRIASRVLGSLQVDISKNSELLDWVPKAKVEEELKRCFTFTKEN